MLIIFELDPILVVDNDMRVMITHAFYGNVILGAACEGGTKRDDRTTYLILYCIITPSQLHFAVHTLVTCKFE